MLDGVFVQLKGGFKNELQRIDLEVFYDKALKVGHTKKEFVYPKSIFSKPAKALK
jgi:hypothetical protein